MVIRDLFPEYGRPGRPTGNLYLSGYPAFGAEGCFDHLLTDVMAERVPVFLFQKQLRRDKADQICRQAVSAGFRAYRLSTTSSICYPFNLLRLSDSPQEQARLAYSFLSDPSDTSASAEIICRYFTDCILYLSEAFPGTAVTMREILSLRIEEVRDGIGRSSRLPDYVIRDESSFLDSSDVYRLWGTVNDRARGLDSTGLLNVLSGTDDPAEVFRGPILLLLCGNPEVPERAGIYDRFLRGIIPLVCRICGGLDASGDSYHIFIHGSGSLGKEHLESLLELGSGSPDVPLPVCMYEQSVAKLVRDHGDSIFQYFTSVGVFRTNEGSFWSDFFGTALQPDITRTYTRRRGLFLGGAARGESVVGRPRGRYEGTSVHRTEKPLFEARIFSALADRQLIFYWAYTNRKMRKQLRW